MHAPPVQRKAKFVKPHAPLKTQAFDLSKPLPKNLKEAMANFLNDYTEAGDIKVVPISRKDNVADAMTKPLGKVLFLKHREALVKGN